MKKLGNTEAELKKSIAYKKGCAAIKLPTFIPLAASEDVSQILYCL